MDSNPTKLRNILCLLLLLTVRSITIFMVRNSSCGKVMFSQVFVKNSVHGGCIPACTWADTSPWVDTPLGQTPLGQTPPWAGTPLPSACLDTPCPAATAADDTHPTGMYSCFKKFLGRDNTPVLHFWRRDLRDSAEVGCRIQSGDLPQSSQMC